MLSRGSGFIAVASLAIIACSSVIYVMFKIKSKDEKTDEKAYSQLIGNTALVELPQLSKLTGCRIFAKVLTHFLRTHAHTLLPSKNQLSI